MQTCKRYQRYKKNKECPNEYLFLGFHFVEGDTTCTVDMVTKLTSIPDDINSVTCSLVPDALIEQMNKDGLNMALCLLGKKIVKMWMVKFDSFTTYSN